LRRRGSRHASQDRPLRLQCAARTAGSLQMGKGDLGRRGVVAAAAERVVLMIPSTAPLAQSYRYCERLARRQAGNFYPAFRLLPKQQRLAMCALYAFLRIADDLADGPGDTGAKRDLLQDWCKQLDMALAGDYQHESHAALHDTMRRYAIPRQYLDDALDGVAMDVGPVTFATFDELYRYCYRVASVVGLAW